MGVTVTHMDGIAHSVKTLLLWLANDVVPFVGCKWIYYGQKKKAVGVILMMAPVK